MQDDIGGVTPEAFTPRDAVADPNFPEAPGITLSEAPVANLDGSIGIRVNVDQIMDQIHQHWAKMLAEQVQRNAELAAALTVTSDELTELRAKYDALTQVTNAPAEDTAGRVRQIPED